MPAAPADGRRLRARRRSRAAGWCVLLAAVVVAVLVGPASTAQAHAFLAGSNPADGQVLAAAPAAAAARLQRVGRAERDPDRHRRRRGPAPRPDRDDACVGRRRLRRHRGAGRGGRRAADAAPQLLPRLLGDAVQRRPAPDQRGAGVRRGAGRDRRRAGRAGAAPARGRLCAGWCCSASPARWAARSPFTSSPRASAVGARAPGAAPAVALARRCSVAGAVTAAAGALVLLVTQLVPRRDPGAAAAVERLRAALGAARARPAGAARCGAGPAEAPPVRRRVGPARGRCRPRLRRHRAAGALGHGAVP